MIVSNSSGLIQLTRLSKASCLRDYAEEVAIPEAVHLEVVETGKREGYAEASLIETFEKDGWVRVKPLGPTWSRMALAVAKTLGLGEAQAIALAKQMRSPLLIDDDHGKRIARYYKVDTLSTLGIMLEFLRAGKISGEEYATNVRRFSSQAWIGADVVEEFLKRANMIE